MCLGALKVGLAFTGAFALIVEVLQPGVGADLADADTVAGGGVSDDALHDVDVIGTGTDDGEGVVHAAQVELADGGGVTLFDEEAATALVEADDDVVFSFGELESVDVVTLVGAWVGQQDHGGGLLDERCGDVGLEGVFGTLGGEDAETVLFTDGLLFVFGELFEAALPVKDLPELVHDVDEWTTVDELF